MRQFFTGALLLLAVTACFSASISPPRRRPSPASPVAGHWRWERRPGIAWLQSATLKGRVLLPDGRPAPGARVSIGEGGWLFDLRFSELIADRSGRFQTTIKLATPPDFVQRKGQRRPKAPEPLHDIGSSVHLGVTAFLPGYAPTWQRLWGSGKGLAPVEIRLQPAATLSGRILRLDGHPAPRVPLQVASLLPRKFDVDRKRPGAQWFGSSRILPDPLVARLYRTQSDASGYFRLTGLPRQGLAELKLTGGWRLAPGSERAVELYGASLHEAGLLVALRPARLRVRVRERPSGKPLPNIQIQNSAVATETVRSVRTNARGEVEIGNLVPGEHLIVVEGWRQRLRLEEGKPADPVEVRLRQGPFYVRVLDPAGRPAAGAEVRVEADVEFNRDDVGVGTFSGFGKEGRIATTGPNGYIRARTFPWGSPAVIVEASYGNARGVWSGPADQIGERVEVRLRPGVRVSVKGRLLDPQGRPLRRATFAVVESEVGASPHPQNRVEQGTTDAEGRFQVDQLERGKPLLLVAGPLFTGGSEGPAFESSRIMTPGLEPSTADTPYDLGDVRVELKDPQEQYRQLIMTARSEPLAHRYGFLPPPTPTMVTASRQVLERYRAALQQGDLDTLHQLTGSVSGNWTPNRPAFLLRSTLRFDLNGDEDSVQRWRPLRFVPRHEAIDLLVLREWEKAVSRPGGSLKETPVDADERVVFLVDVRSTEVRMGAILQRDGEGWRVMAPPAVPHVPYEHEPLLVKPVIARGAEVQEFLRPAPLPDSSAQRAALQVGERYLKAWVAGQEPELLALTSPLALDYADNLAAFRKQRPARLDQGVCPLAAGASLALEMLSDLTIWEQKFLVQHPFFTAWITGLAHPARLRAARPPGFPEAYIRRGNLLTASYQAGHQECLMLLIRHQGRWQVLEPAIRR